MRFVMASRYAQLFLLAGVTGLLTFAQTSRDDPSPGKGPLPNWLLIGGQIRGRLEIPGGSDFTTSSFDPYLLTRLRLNVGIKPRRWLKFYAETQDTRALGYKLTPPASMQNPLDLRQAYVQLISGERRGVMLQVGRQEMAIGSSRLLSIGPWSNTSKSFDEIRAAVYTPKVRFEWIAGSLVQTDGSRFDRHKPGEHFYASYNTFGNLVKGASIEPYFIAKTTVKVTGELGPAGDAAVYTAGLRWFGKLPARFDYSAETIHQWGSWASSRVSAGAGTYALGWRIADSGWKPRVSADYSFGSGDRNPKDGKRGALDLIYGANQPFFSYTGMVCWKNIKTFRAGTDLTAGKKTKIVLDYRDFRLSTVQDGFYNSSGTQVVLNRKATSAHVGHGPDVQIARTAGPFGQMTVGIAGIVAGEYLKQAGKSSGYVYPYLMWAKQF